MSLSRISAVEIFTHPEDLCISLFEQQGKFGVLLARGPGHNYKAIISSIPVFDRSGAVEMVRSLLSVSEQEGLRILKDPSSFLYAFINPNNVPIEEIVNCLTPELISRIVKDLSTEDMVDTSTYDLART